MSRSLLLLNLFWLLLIAVNWSTALGQNNLPWASTASDSADATLRACVASSIDRIWAVGDRGLVMSSVDGGRNWRRVELGSGANFHQVCFADDQHGWIVGGFVWPVSGRSEAVIYRTTDAGETWTNLPANGVSKLVGIQAFGPNNLIAWGDWSTIHQSSLFESNDGGETFIPRAVPCSHIAAATWLDPIRGVVVDRLSRVFVCQDGQRFSQVNLPSTMLAPIRDASNDGLSVWLVGSKSQIYRSDSLTSWEQVHLPFTSADRDLLDLRNVAANDGSIWITGNIPGLLLHSVDGRDFSLHQTGSAVPLCSVQAVTPEHVIAVGPMAKIIETRNSGEGWWVKHENASRLSMLAIAARLEDLPLDALTLCALGEKRQAAGLVVHSQNAFEGADAWAESHSRLQDVANICASVNLDVMPFFPVSAMQGSSNRQDDLVGYEQGLVSSSSGSPSPTDRNGIRAASLVERELVVAIRSLRPDVIVMSATDERSDLVTRCNTAILQAVQLASDPSFHAFSVESGLGLPAWKVTRTVRRTPRVSSSSLADWTIEANALLGNSGQTVSDRVRIASCLIGGVNTLDELIDPYFEQVKLAKETPTATIFWNNPKLYGDYWAMTGGRRSVSQAKSYFAGLTEDSSAMRNVGESKIRNLQVLMATLKQQDAFASLVKQDLTTTLQRKKWLHEVSNYTGTLGSDERCRFLLELAIIKLHGGDWLAFRQSLEFLFLEPKRNAWQEIGEQLAIRFCGSAEYAHAFQTTDAIEAPSLDRNATTASKLNTTSQPAAFVSPFEKDLPVQQAAAISEANQTPNPVVAATFAAAVSINELAVYESHPLVGVAPDLLESLWGKQRHLRLDPRMVFSTHSLIGKRSSTNANFDSPIKSLLPTKQLLGWSALASHEAEISRPVASVNSNSSQAVTRESMINDLIIKSVQQRPNLDGDFNDEMWQSCQRIELRSPWSIDVDRCSNVRLASDGEFLFIACNCPAPTNVPGGLKSARTSSAKISARPETTRARDSDLRELDSVVIRIDTDRDYQSYFELAVAADGRTHDRLSGITAWDPKWFVANANNEQGWTSEIAIAWSELTPRAKQDFENNPLTMAINIQRLIPGVGPQSMTALPSDSMLMQSFRIVSLQPQADAD